MRPIRFPDAQRAMRDALRAALAERPEGDGVTVGCRIPGTASDDRAPLPYVLVRTDVSGRDSRLNGYAVVRVTVYHRDEPAALALAYVCEALALAARTPEVRAVQPTQSPIPTTDPETGDRAAFFTVTARLTPEPL